MCAVETPLTLADFLERSEQVLEKVERGEVILHRGGGDDLVLVSGRQWRAFSDSLRLLAEAYAEAAAAPGASLGGDCRQTWLSLLRPEDQAACIAELARAAAAARVSGRLDDLLTALSQWRATALATWDDERRDRPASDADEARPLPRP